MSYFAVDSSNYTINTSFALTRTSNIKGLTCSSNCTINTAGYFLSVSDISVNTGYTLILDNSGGGGISSSFNLNSGNLQLNLANDLPCNITNNGNLIFNLPYKDCIYYGSLSGLGTVKKTGAYNLTMTNNNTISGAIEVMTGTMTVNGTLLNSTITIDSSANLSGFGSVGNVIISPNATISSSKINNGLTISSVSNTLVAGNGMSVNNNIISLATPTWVKVVKGGWQAMAYTSDNKLFGWGTGMWPNNTALLTVVPNVTQFQLPELNVSIVDLVCNHQSFYLLLSSGNLYVWGANNFGQLGTGSTTDTTIVLSRINVKQLYYPQKNSGTSTGYRNQT